MDNEKMAGRYCKASPWWGYQDPNMKQRNVVSPWRGLFCANDGWINM